MRKKKNKISRLTKTTTGSSCNPTIRKRMRKIGKRKEIM
jgi:hypothetical protein